MPTFSFDELQTLLKPKFLKHGFNETQAETLSYVYAENTLYGVASHGVNRVPSFFELLQKGHIYPNAKPEKVNAYNAYEQWDAHQGAGPLNALAMAERAMELADEYGAGLVALRNSNHWMRPGNYAWRAAERGYIFIGWTNTIPIMPPWGTKESTTGNNPMVIGVPKENGPVVIDMAMSLYSYGKLANYRRDNEPLPIPGGYDKDGNLTTDAAAILEAQRPLPMGYWKGSGLSLMLDLTASILSGGNATKELGRLPDDTAMSQIFIAFAPGKFSDADAIKQRAAEIVAYYMSAEPAEGGGAQYPGQNALATKERHLKEGIPVHEIIYERIMAV